MRTAANKEKACAAARKKHTSLPHPLHECPRFGNIRIRRFWALGTGATGCTSYYLGKYMDMSSRMPDYIIHSWVNSLLALAVNSLRMSNLVLARDESKFKDARVLGTF